LFPTEVINTFITTTTTTSISLPPIFIFDYFINGGIAPGVSFEFSVYNATGTNVSLSTAPGISTVPIPRISGSNSLVISSTNTIARFRIVFISYSNAIIIRVF
jgi:hypothetical protein